MAISSRIRGRFYRSKNELHPSTGKVLLPCLGRPMLKLIVERVKRGKHVDAIVIATTVNASDDPLCS
jgi:spore coat polysaccharide biosynthesis protein SpsF (cytidylyltransferase family)